MARKAGGRRQLDRGSLVALTRGLRLRLFLSTFLSFSLSFSLSFPLYYAFLLLGCWGSGCGIDYGSSNLV